MKTMEDFLKLKDKYLEKGYSVKEIIKIFNILDKQYIEKIGNAESKNEFNAYSTERFMLFCVKRSMIASLNPPANSFECSEFDQIRFTA